MSEVRILAVAAGRGGTGKSTIAFALADALRQATPELDVALVDLDPQAGLTGYAKCAPSADPVHDQPAAVHGLTLYRGGRALAHATDEEIGTLLERALTGGRAGADRVLVVDMAPALTDAAHRVVFDRDDVMLVGAIKTEPGSFQSMNELVAYVARRGLPYVLVPTIHRNVLLNNTMLLTMRQQHAGHVSDIVVPLDGKAAECVIHGKPVTMFAKNSKAAKALRALVEELFGTAGAAAPDPADEGSAEPAADTRPGATTTRRS
jgi:chromosome partitioning protein